jgi:hypothetical protein
MACSWIVGASRGNATSAHSLLKAWAGYRLWRGTQQECAACDQACRVSYLALIPENALVTQGLQCQREPRPDHRGSTARHLAYILCRFCGPVFVEQGLESDAQTQAAVQHVIALLPVAASSTLF